MTEQASKFDMVDWNELSRRGLIIRINNEVLHPLGLAVCRNDHGASPGAMVSDDGKWEYAAVDPKQTWLESLDETIDLLDVMDELGLKAALREVRSFVAHNMVSQSSVVGDLETEEYGEECVHEFVPFQPTCKHCDEPYKG